MTFSVISIVKHVNPKGFGIGASIGFELPSEAKTEVGLAHDHGRSHELQGSYVSVGWFHDQVA